MSNGVGPVKARTPTGKFPSPLLAYPKVFRRAHKSDAHDALAIAEAAQRPELHPAPVRLLERRTGHCVRQPVVSPWLSAPAAQQTDQEAATGRHAASQIVSMAAKHRVRRDGAGRPRRTDADTDLCAALEELVEPTTRGDPMSPLRWTCKSVRTLAAELDRQGHPVSHQTVSELLHSLGYSLQVNRKTREGAGHPDRNAQFEHIARRAKQFQRRGQPVISVDTKKKEWVGDFKNAGQEWYPKGQPPVVQVHDFQDKELGKAIPYGVYDLRANAGWVSIGIDHDTPEFAVESVYCWWRQMGPRPIPKHAHC